MRILGVFAHPDDETFCMGGTVAKLVATGAEAMIVSFTQGESGQIRDSKTATRNTLGKVRAQELKHACKHLGVQQVSCLDYGDGKLTDIDFNTLVEKNTEIIREFKPDVVVTFDATGGYGHPDHVTISRATKVAFSYAGNEKQFPHQIASGLTPHQPFSLYHSYFPRSSRLLMEQLVEWLGSLETKFHGNVDFAHGLMLLSDESTMLGFASDHLKVEWYPAGFYIIEQGEPPSSLYLILSGRADVIQEQPDGRLEKVDKLGPGQFIGEMAFAEGKKRNAHVIAIDNMSCLVFSPGKPADFAGRGEDAQYMVGDPKFQTAEDSQVTTRIEVIDHVDQKMAAISSHRSQYPITTDMFPKKMLVELFGYEYFIRVHPPVELETELLSGIP